ncbi:MAG: FAD binding domain-containing protein [Spirochaetales bacterium]|nr:FAD binding domain-containing protein [Spirochaetales bacterium]
MNKPAKQAHIYTPRNTSELQALRKAHPRSFPFGGGTYVMSPWTKEVPTGDIISLDQLSDTLKLNKTESYLEVGSGITLEKLLSLKRHLGSRALYEALTALGNGPLRTRATLGGNIALKAKTVNLPAVLYLLGTRLEVRGLSGSAWIPIRKYYEEASDNPDPWIITRIRIPIFQSAFERYEIFQERSGLESGALSFCCLADLHKDGIISSFGCSFCINGTGVLRNPDMESLVEGKKRPLSGKDISRAVESLEEMLESHSTPLLPWRKHQITALLFDTLKKLGDL